MGSGKLPPLRALPRIFLPGAVADGAIDLPREEDEKLRKVLRLAQGDQIAILPNDGTLIRCEYRAGEGHPLSVEHPRTEPDLELVVAQALPKGDRLDAVVRQCTELGVAGFILFESERTVVRWESKKLSDKMRRFEALVREAAEQSYRTKLPFIQYLPSLKDVLQSHTEAVVLSEVEGLERTLQRKGDRMVIVVGPEGGWAPRELQLIGDRGVTLGPRVLRTDTAAPAAAAMLLLPR